MEKVTRQVTLDGKKYNVVFNMAVQIKYEKISGQPFDLQKMDTQTATMQMCFASLQTGNKEMPFTLDELAEKISMAEWVSLKNAVIDSMSEWFNMPDVMGNEEASSEGAKN